MSVNGGKKTFDTEILRCLYPKSIIFDYRWVIQNFAPNSKYESPIFSLECNGNLKCFLKYDGSSSSPQLYFCVQPHNSRLDKIRFKFFILQSDGTKLEIAPIQEPLVSISSKEVTEYKCNANKNQFLFGNNVSSKSSVQLLCWIQLFFRGNNTLENHTRVIAVPDGQLPENLGKCLESSICSDIVININGQKFPAHKMILAARSRVFAAMFEHKMTEQHTSTVNIINIEPDVFRVMLKYIYTDKAPNLEIWAEKLLIAAEKYELERLKLLCEEELRKNLTIDNAASTLVLADRQNAAQLKQRAIDFIATNVSVIQERESFRAIAYSHPYLILQILQASTKLH